MSTVRRHSPKNVSHLEDIELKIDTRKNSNKNSRRGSVRESDMPVDSPPYYSSFSRGTRRTRKRTQSTDVRSRASSSQVSAPIRYSFLRSTGHTRKRSQSTDIKSKASSFQAPIYCSFLKSTGHRRKRTQSTDVRSKESSVQGYFDKYLNSLKSDTKQKAGNFKSFPCTFQKVGRSNDSKKTYAINTIRVAASKPRNFPVPPTSKKFSMRPSSTADEKLRKRKVAYHNPCTKTSLLKGSYPLRSAMFQFRTHLNAPKSYRSPDYKTKSNKYHAQQNSRRSENKHRIDVHSTKQRVQYVTNPKFSWRGLTSADDHTRNKSCRRCEACESLSKKAAGKKSNRRKLLPSLAVEVEQPIEHLTRNDQCKTETKNVHNTIYYGTSRIMSSSERVKEWLDGIPSYGFHPASGDSKKFTESRKEKTETKKNKMLKERAEGSKENYNTKHYRVLGKQYVPYGATHNIDFQKRRRYRTRKKDKSEQSMGTYGNRTSQNTLQVSHNTWKR